VRGVVFNDASRRDDAMTMMMDGCARACASPGDARRRARANDDARTTVVIVVVVVVESESERATRARALRAERIKIDRSRGRSIDVDDDARAPRGIATSVSTPRCVFWTRHDGERAGDRG